MTPKGLLFLLCTVTCTVLGQVLMKKGITVNGAVSLKNIFTNPFLLIGVSAYVASFIFWLNVLKLVPLSKAYPFSSISYVAIILASAIFLNERITVGKLIGVALICAGVFASSR